MMQTSLKFNNLKFWQQNYQNFKLLDFNEFFIIYNSFVSFAWQKTKKKRK